MIYDQITDEYACANKCKDLNLILDYNKCVSSCPSERPIIISDNGENKCSDSCENDKFINKMSNNLYECVSNCQSKNKFLNENTCVNNCPSTKNYLINKNDEIFCSISCDDEYKFINEENNNKDTIYSLSREIKKEGIVYGRILLMTTEYCTIGTFKNCQGICTNGKYSLKDRMNFEFPIYADRVNCNNLIYNSKITSISYKDLNLDSIRIDILDETEAEIQNIIDTYKKGNRLEGQNYTNGNLNREI